MLRTPSRGVLCSKGRSCEIFPAASRNSGIQGPGLLVPWKWHSKRVCDVSWNGMPQDLLEITAGHVVHPHFLEMLIPNLTTCFSPCFSRFGPKIKTPSHFCKRMSLSDFETIFSSASSGLCAVVLTCLDCANIVPICSMA